MRFYFLRHADAIDGEDDAARPLSAKGRQQCLALGRFLQQAGLEFDVVYASPLVRARQTAEQVLQAAGLPHVPVTLTRELLNESPLRGYERWLRTLPVSEHVLLVGHAPTLSARVRRLLSLTRSDALELKKGALACVETDDRKAGSLKFLVAPKILGWPRSDEPAGRYPDPEG